MTAECEARGASFAGTVCLDGYCRPGGLDAGAGGGIGMSGGGGSGDGAAGVGGTGGTGGTGDTSGTGGGGTGGGGTGGGGAGAAGAAGAGGVPPPLPEQWACLEAPPPTPVVPPEVTIALDFLSYGSKVPNEGLQLTVCRRLDPGCLQPHTKATTDAAGRAVFVVPTGGNGSGGPKGFAGYVEVRSPDDSLVPMLIFFNPDVVSDEVDPPYLDLTTFKRAEFASLVQLAAGEYDPTRGHVVLAAQRCDGGAAQGVHYEIDQSAEGMAGFYMASGLPSTTARRTDVSGVGGFVKTPVAFLTITGQVWDDAYNGPIADIAQVQVQTRADWATITRLAPRRPPPSQP